MEIKNKYNIGNYVFLKTDVDQRPRLVTEILINHVGPQYKVVLGDTCSWHYEIEMSMEKNVLMELGL